MTDFHLATMLLGEGGWIILDDAAYPAVQSVVSFIEANRNDFEVSSGEIPNTAILRRISADERPWDHFRPFTVPQRDDWTPDPVDPPELPDDWGLLGLE